MMIADLSSHAWFNTLHPSQQRSIVLTLELLDREKKYQNQYSDYSFVLFPLAKAYEGFLKSFLFSMGLINEHIYLGKRFRIGRALNPDISFNQRDEWWLYDNVERLCGEDLARKIWKNWVDSRNHVFHFFPSEKNEFTLQQIEQKIFSLLEVFETAWQCEMREKKKDKILREE